PDAPLWDEFDPRLIDLDVSATCNQSTVTRRVRFGLRDFGTNGTQFTLNGRPYFVRGTLECCIFPLTGYPATDVQQWRRMMETARQYGLNHIRFHSWCPPEAAFIAADESGITLQIETPVWGDLGKNPDVDLYIHDEAGRIMEAYGNHPSFAMLAVGNEPSGPNKDAFLTDIVTKWKAKDPRRLYTTCSGWPELPVSDYHVVHERNGKPYRLHGGPLAPNSAVDYRDVLEGSPQPAISHELGQWCVYPDYREIPNYTGTLRARNLEGFRDSLARAGMLDQAADFARASGKLQRLMYKADIEIMLRTHGAGGFQLLALQDFPGQGSALEGFVDAFWNSKGVVMPDEFRRFCSETVPLLRLEKFVWKSDETLKANAEIAHFGAMPLAHARPCWSARTADGKEVASGQWPERDIPLGNGIALGEISLPLNAVHTPAKLTFTVYLAGTVYANSWDVWVYPSDQGMDDAKNILVADEWSREVSTKLRDGGKVLLLPKTIAPMRRVKSAFEPIFWNTQWFPGQSRQLGVLCDSRHPAFASFPNDGYSDWQWWEVLNGSQVARLDDLPPAYRPLIQVIDDWNKNRKLGAVFEGRVGKGRLMVCTLDLRNGLDQRPAAAALRASLLRYMNSKAFEPGATLSPSWLKEMFTPGETLVAQVEADSAAQGYGPENALDGNANTVWHTPWESGAPSHPHELRICYASELTLTGLRYVPRQDVANGFVGKYAVYAAKDGRNWGKPIAEGELAPGQDPQEIKFTAPVKTRWLRFVALSNPNSEPFTAIAEVEAKTAN
ncbi:MAG: discoidin domain-containing protein, partial [Candidatus Hydrogenedentales bacterium]